jgi:hypothetical protein
MKKKLIIFLFSFQLLSSFAQLDGECFIEVKKQNLEETKNIGLVKKTVLEFIFGK